MADEDEIIPHPCVRNCCLDEDEVCMGCFRSLEEILAWHSATTEQKREILQRCVRRKQIKQRLRGY